MLIARVNILAVIPVFMLMLASYVHVNQALPLLSFSPVSTDVWLLFNLLLSR